MPLIDNYIEQIEASLLANQPDPVRIFGDLCGDFLEKWMRTRVNPPKHSGFIHSLCIKMNKKQLSMDHVLAEFNRHQRPSGPFGIRRNDEVAMMLSAFLAFYPHYEAKLETCVLEHLPPRPALLFRYVSIPDTTQTLFSSESDLLEKLVPYLLPAQIISAKKSAVQAITQTTLTLPDSLEEAAEVLDRRIEQLKQPNEKVNQLINKIQRDSDLTISTKREFCRQLTQPDHFVHPTQSEQIQDYLSAWFYHTGDRLFTRTANHVEAQKNNYDTLKKLCGEFKHHSSEYLGNPYLTGVSLELKREQAVTLLLLLSDEPSLAKTSIHEHIREAAVEIEEKSHTLDARMKQRPLHLQLYYLTQSETQYGHYHNKGRINCVIIGQLAPYISAGKFEALLQVFEMRIKNKDTAPFITMAISSSLILLVPFLPKALISTTLLECLLNNAIENRQAQAAFKHCFLAQPLDIQVYYTYGVIGTLLKEQRHDVNNLSSLQGLFCDLVAAINSQKPKPQIANTTVADTEASEVKIINKPRRGSF